MKTTGMAWYVAWSSWLRPAHPRATSPAAVSITTGGWASCSSRRPRPRAWRLLRFIFPGTHDSGTYELESSRRARAAAGAVPDIVKHCEEGLIPPPANLICGVVTTNVIATRRTGARAVVTLDRGPVARRGPHLTCGSTRRRSATPSVQAMRRWRGHYYIHHTVAVRRAPRS